MDNSPEWLATLRREPGLERLIDGLWLAKGFHFFLLVCDTHRTADAALDIIRDEVAASRGEEVVLVRIDPYQGRDPQEPITVEVLFDSVLGRLVDPGMEERAVGMLLVIDATLSPERDEAVWAQLFGRMNQLRNVIAGRIGGSLILCLPPFLEPVFAHAAPDFWSIRSAAVTVSAPAPVPEVLMRGPIEPGPAVVGDADAERLAELQRALVAARARAAEAPDDPSALHALSVWLYRLAELELELFQMQQAVQPAEEGLDVIRRLLEKAPVRTDWLSDLASFQLLLARALAHRDLEGALASAEQGVSTLRSLLEQDPGRADIKLQLAKGLRILADMYLNHVRTDESDKNAQIARAQGAAEEGLSIVDELLAQGEQPDLLFTRATLLLVLGGCREKLEDWPRASAASQEAVAIIRRLVARDPGQLEWLILLSVALMHAGNALLHDKADVQGTRALLEELVPVARKVYERRPQLRLLLAGALFMLGAALEVSGQVAEGKRLQQESRALLEIPWSASTLGPD